MFAGPNGSGKSTLKTVLRPELLGVYLNADDMERELKRTGSLLLADYSISATEADARDFFNHSQFLKTAGMDAAADSVHIGDGKLRVI